MNIINLSNPGHPPIDGDLISIEHDNGTIERVSYTPPPEPVVTTPVSDPRIWWVDVGPFFDRFGTHKYAILADQAPVVQALIKDCSVRKYIDLQRVDLPTGLAMLVDAGHAIDVQAILTAPTTDDERHVKGLA